MKAALLEAFGQPLRFADVPDPLIGTGEVIVEVTIAPVLSYAHEILSGVRNHALQLPVVPGGGAIGRVRALGPDATSLAIGDWVMTDPTVRSRDNPLTPDIELQGIAAPTPGAQRLHAYFHDGSWAEQIRVPTENATALGPLSAAEATQWMAMGRLLVPFGGLLAGELKPGEVLVVNGATGPFGSAGVMVGLALGARAVIATGRNERALAELVRRLGPRVIAVPMRGDETADRASILAAAPAPIDCVLDLLPPAATPAQVRAAALAVRPNGRVVLMGGVGMQGGEPLALPYPWLMRNNITVRGQWMYPRWAITRLAGVLRAGLIDLGQLTVTTFPLDRANDAVAHAAAHAGPFELTAICP
ncbi:MAG: alcohol dehydrogenase [Labilithrix sp.]|nr:alcohol dehydrogenase [Labilithrix sp.]